MHSTYSEPLNIGSDQLISVDDFTDLIANIAGIKIKKKHIKGPQGVRGRNSDNTLIKKVLGWYPKTRLEKGMLHTYKWIESQVAKTI